MTTEKTEPKFKVGDFVTETGTIIALKVQFLGVAWPVSIKPKTEETMTCTGIVYENGGEEKAGGQVRFQLANGDKVRGVAPASLKEATPKEVKAFEAEAVEGMTPEAIIAREEAETKAHKDHDGSESDEPEDE